MEATASRSEATSLGDLAHRLDTGAQGVGLALQLVQAAAVVAGQPLGGGALDRDRRELLADGVGAALDLLDALERGGELGARGLALALAVALQALDRGRELDAGGLRGLLVLGADLLELGGDVDLAEAGLEAGAGGLEAAAGFGDRLDGARLGGGDGLGETGVGDGGGLGAVALELVDAARSVALRGGLGLRERGVLLVAVELARDAGQRALQIGAQGGGVAVGGGGALVGLAARLVELRRQAAGDALELVDALQRAQQAGDDRGGVVEVGDAALDAGIGVGEPLLGLRVGGGALGLAARELGLDPRGRGQRAEDDQRAGGAPALPRLRRGLERLAAARGRRPGAAGACAAASGSSAARRTGPRGRARSRSPRRA